MTSLEKTDWDQLELELAMVDLSLLKYETPREVVWRLAERDRQA